MFLAEGVNRCTGPVVRKSALGHAGPRKTRRSRGHHDMAVTFGEAVEWGRRTGPVRRPVALRHVLGGRQTPQGTEATADRRTDCSAEVGWEGAKPRQSAECSRRGCVPAPGTTPHPGTM